MKFEAREPRNKTGVTKTRAGYLNFCTIRQLRAGASSVQDCRSGLRSLARPRAAVPWSTQLCRRLAWPPTSPFCWHQHAVPPVKLTTVANRALPVVGPRTWNDLPDDATSAFRQRLKTHMLAKKLFLSISWTGLHLTSL